MKRWIIEYFDIDTMENDVMVIISHEQDVLECFSFFNSWYGICLPLMGIREDGSIGGG